MRRPRPAVLWLAVPLLLAAVAWFGGRWLVSRVYPLDYRDILFKQATEHQLDPYLVAAVIRTESRFRTNVTSPKGARGLMQIMPETGQWIAQQLRLPYSHDLLYDPAYNIRIGCWYLASLQNDFGGDMVLALAAYNAGHTNVRQWLKEHRWTGEQAHLSQIPFPETRMYVSQVLRDFDRYKRIYRSG